MTYDRLLAYLERQIALSDSQDAYAKRLGISPQYLSNIVNGVRQPGKKLLSALGLEKVIAYAQKD